MLHLAKNWILKNAWFLIVVSTWGLFFFALWPGYVVIGPWERRRFKPNEAFFRGRYPVVLNKHNSQVYRVKRN